MLDFYFMLFGCTLLALFCQPNIVTSYGIINKNKNKKIGFLVFIIFVWLTLFSGLRTKYNDTAAYTFAYMQMDVSMASVRAIFEPYGGFIFIELIFKYFFPNNAQPLLLFFAIIINYSYLRFIIKYSDNYSGSVFLYGIGMFVFSMAGLKQAIAMSIALYAIEAYLNRKYIKTLLILLLAMTFHPYVIVFLVIPLLTERTFSFKVLGIISLIVFAVLSLELVFDSVFLFGQEFSFDELSNSYTINPFRVFVEFIPIAIMFLYRQQINESNDSLLILSVNMCIISYIFIFVGLFINPIYPGRMATYFDILYCITMPKVLHLGLRENQYRKIAILGYYIFFFVYFLLDLTKLGAISMFADRFNHVSITELFK